MAVVASSQPLNFSAFYAQGLVVGSNTYYSPLADLSADPRLTPLGGFGAWQAAGFDAGSRIADPLFADPEGGHFALAPESPALAAGFVPLPAGLDRC